MSTTVKAPQKTAIFVDGRKGGIGKSTVSMVLVEYFLAKSKLRLKGYDLDGNGVFQTRYPDHVAAMACNKAVDLAYAIDNLDDNLDDPSEETDVAVIDIGCPAGSNRGDVAIIPVIDEFVSTCVVDHSNTGAVKVIIMWVIGDSFESITHLDNAVRFWDSIGLNFDLVLVKNTGRSPMFDHLLKHELGLSIIKGFNPYMIEFPTLPFEACQETDTQRLTYRDYVGNYTDKKGRKRSNCFQNFAKLFLQKAFAEFDKIPGLADLVASCPAEQPAPKAVPGGRYIGVPLSQPVPSNMRAPDPQSGTEIAA